MNLFPFSFGVEKSAASSPFALHPQGCGIAGKKMTLMSSRRRKLWELPSMCHCPIVGVCFSCNELRSLINKVAAFPRDSSDFLLHTTAVGKCSERSTLSELLHKTLEKRYRLDVQRASTLKTSGELRRLWQEACRQPSEIPSALWVVWSHPACDTELECDVYGDIHMIQHQVGAGNRVEAGTMKRLKEENRLLHQQIEIRNRALQSNRESERNHVRQLQAENLDLRTRLAASETQGEQWRKQLQTSPNPSSSRTEHERLRAQCDEFQQLNKRLKGELTECQRELDRLRISMQQMEALLADLSSTEEEQDVLPPCHLNGKCVLCVGGRSGMVNGYRETVERSGGRFMHHDGGLEESLHRIDGIVANADIVICQAGCVSHGAYWKVKNLCRLSGKSCLFVKSPGIRSFARTVAAAGKNQSEPPTPPLSSGR